jgi:putative Mg2+ transporter-C (MgtC) family protein
MHLWLVSLGAVSPLAWADVYGPSSVAQFTNFTLNVLAALVMGVAIGIERQWYQHPAGLRTNALVAIGSALFVGLSGLLAGAESSPTRIAAQVVSGLGFLGGGVILREGLNVRGLNTAATLWCSGAIGSLCGAGFPLAGLVGTIAILVIHLGLRPLVFLIETRKETATHLETYYRIRVECASEHDAVVRGILLRHVGDYKRMSLKALTTAEVDAKWTAVTADIYSLDRNDRAMEELVARVCIEPHIKSVRWERTMA